MGMAASQARFLGLTARKTNTEFEGQQINQQRTMLSNQSANYYNQLLGMTVPVPPSIDDYTKVTYTFSDGALTNTLTSMMATSTAGLYKVSYLSTYTNDFAVVSATPAIYTKYTVQDLEAQYNGNTYIKGETDKDGFTTYTYVDKNTGKTSYLYYYNKTKNWYTKPNLDENNPPINGDNRPKFETTDCYKVGAVDLRELGTVPGAGMNDPYYESLSQAERTKLLAEEGQYITQLNEKFGTKDGDWMVRYVQNTADGTWKPMFTRKSDLEGNNIIYDEHGNSLSSIKTYTIGSAQESQEIKGVDARIEKDASGRIINVTLNAGTDQAVTYAVSTSTVTDNDKYKDAMSQYEYDKNQYQQTIQEINAKIEVVQAEDRNLELRLKQLDTEQSAIQTEMEAVTKIIEKNTESTFKTFG